ncbi:nucleoside hydrolase [Paenibacillus sp. BIHB 4019]|uniref:Nucleoside hydrolase n=1 Tax=Paenibacillus sp. BIHB 4019 TaxID=1870819 RepID=A0A1B2DP86_9BACL|nr:nucleoside hydrolase [Paenibacillus sp. BIHB 4019]ANY69526.1 nucleoside hydrolase [Paenibacillus sp. BIHB 4019]
MTDKKRILLDVDTGVDDAIAILYALLSPEIKVEGITTGYGNTTVEQATDNTLRVVQLANCGYEVPVAAGAVAPTVRPSRGTDAHIHGHNGIGDAVLPPSSQQPLKENAVDFIIRKAAENPGELTLVTTGRMTNLALALKKAPELARQLKQVVTMGGTLFAPGNVTPVAEANIYADPEAAAAVFASDVPLTIVGLDVTVPTRLTGADLDKLARYAPEHKQAIIRFLNESLGVYFEFYRKVNYFIEECPMHDALAVLVALNPSLVTTQKFNAVVDCSSGLTAGMIVTDRRPRPSVGRSVEFCVEVDSARAIRQMMSVFWSE